MVNLRVLTKADRRAALFITVLGVLYGVALLRNDRLFIDDLGRSLFGPTSWTSLGRPLSDVILVLFNLSPIPPDISPLPQICGIALVSMASWIVYCRLREESWPAGISIASAVMLLLNPFLLENMSYKFDGLPMMLGLFLSTLPFVLRPTSYNLRHFVIVFLCLMATLLLYQTSVNVFLALLAVFVFSAAVQHNRGFADTPKLFFAYIVPFLMACLAYFTAAKYLINGPYALQQMQSVQAAPSLVYHALGNGRRIFVYVSSMLTGSIGALILVLLAMSVLSVATFVAQRRKQRGLADWLGRVLCCATPALAVLALAGPLLLLSIPFVLPRLLIGFGGTLAFLALASAAFLDFWFGRLRLSEALRLSLSIAPASVLIFGLVSLAFSYGVVEKALEDQEKHIAMTTATQIAQHGVDDNVPVVIDGVEPFPLRIRKTLEHSPVLMSLAPRHFNNDWIWGIVLLNSYGLRFSAPTAEVRQKALAELWATDLKPFYKDKLMSLFKTRNAVVMKFAAPPL